MHPFPQRRTKPGPSRNAFCALNTTGAHRSPVLPPNRNTTVDSFKNTS